MLRDRFDPSKTPYFELPKRDFPYVAYAIGMTLIISVFYFIGGGLLTEVFFGDEAVSLLAYLNAAAQILFMLLPVILASVPIPLKMKTLFRLDTSIDIQILSLAFLSLLSFQFFVSGYAGLQELLIPESLIDEYNSLNKMIEELYDSLLGGDTYLSFFRAILIGAIIPAISEEAVFRGFLQRSLEQKLKPIYAIVISGVLFGLIHFNPIDMVPLILIGVFLAYLAYISKNLLIPIIIHFANNAFAISMYYLSDTDLTGSSVESLSPTLSAIFCFSGLFITIYLCYVMYIRATKSSGY